MRSVAPGETDFRTIVNAIRHHSRKRDGEVTLTANAASTTVTDLTVTEESVILLMPLTANAAAAIATTYITTARGSFVITHANNAQTDKNFRWLAAGD